MASNQNVQERLNAILTGRYQVEREIGSGGMATVYLAQDLKHHRPVAVKVLNPDLSAVVGTERFLGEIRTTANLQHPHILPLFDSGEADGLLFYVMPYVEGESLRKRLDRENQLPVREAVRIAVGVAEALQAAHDDEVIHRDIKPANIMLQKDKPLVADFGIALAVSAAGGGRLTETGLSLGTPSYMSPEQAAGDHTATAASDVYSLGCVLYEMLTGDPPHLGSSAQAILGKILTGEVTDPTKLRRAIPANVGAVALKALERLPADRFRTAAEFTGALKNVAFRYTPGGAPGQKTSIRKPLLWASLAAVAVAAAFVFGLSQSEEQVPSPGVVRTYLPLQEDQLLSAAPGVDVALAANGSRLAYVGVGGAAGARLWQKSLDEFEPLSISGTASPSNPALSPEGRSVAFIRAGAIWTVPLDGGPATPILLEGVSTRGLDWGRDGFLYFTDLEGAITRVPSTGGDSEAVTYPSPTARHTGVDVLPGGRGVLFTLNDSEPGAERGIAVAGFGGEPARVLFRGNMGRYLAPGYLVFTNRSGQLMAAGFDLERLEPTSDPVPVISGLASPNVNYSEFAVSENGDLLYRADPLGSSGDFIWVYRDGTTEEVDTDLTGDFRNPVLSPDGGRLAFDRVEGEIALWVRDLQLRSDVRVWLNATGEHRPAWTEDGQSVTFSRYLPGSGLQLWTARADRAGEPEAALELGRSVEEGLWSSNGEWLVARTDNGGPGAGDILAFRSPVDSEAEAVPLATSGLRELSPAISPSGQFLAYTSEGTGGLEVVVTPFPETDEWIKVVSPNGGTEPVWGNTGREIFYRNANDDLVSLQYEEGPEFIPGQETVLFSAQAYRADPEHAQYDVSPNDDRFVMVRPQEAGTYTLVFVGNFLKEVIDKVGVDGR